MLINKKYVSTLFIVMLLFSGCESENSDTSTSVSKSSYTYSSSNIQQKSSSSNDDKQQENNSSCESVVGLISHPAKLQPTSYRLEQLNDNEFNSFTEEKRLKIATNLLNTLFFDYPFKIKREGKFRKLFI